MVSKKAAGSSEKVSKKTAAKKVSLKSTVKKATSKSVSAKTSSEKVLNAQIPVKADVNPVKDVLEIKAHNAEKKAAKVAKKAMKEVAKNPVSEKGAKVAVSRTKVAKVKENAQKAAVKNFTETKRETGFGKNVSSAKDGLWAALINGYKNIFNFSGRTSRYEFWAFMLSNLITVAIALPILLWISALVVKSGAAVLGVLVVVLIAETLVFLSMTARRLHDTGASAWKGYFKAVVMSFLTLVLLVVLAVVITSTIGSEQLDTTLWRVVSVLYGLLFTTTTFIFMYYTTKVSIASSYYEGEDKDNAYGTAEFNDDYHKAKGLQYTVLCMTIVSIFYMIWGAFSKYSYGGFEG